jgi:hypothetical protein
MNRATFRFYAELGDFLPPSRREGEYLWAFQGQPAVKHLIEAQGVPHTEVARITLNQAPADFHTRVGDGDRVEVYPWSACPRDEALAGEARFVLDNHLGKLATYLRILGFDSLYDSSYQDDELAAIAAGQKRILLTRDRQLLMRRAVQRGYWVRDRQPQGQALEVLLRYNLFGGLRPFHRCLRCNAELAAVPKAQILHRLEPLTRQYYDDFHLCPACDQVYWQGSHYAHMQALIELVRAQAPPGEG